MQCSRLGRFSSIAYEAKLLSSYAYIDAAVPKSQSCVTRVVSQVEMQKRSKYNFFSTATAKTAAREGFALHPKD